MAASELERRIQALDSFTTAMMERLVANQHKGDWRLVDPRMLFAQMKTEIMELYDALAVFDGSEVAKLSVRHEAADVAVFAMAIADRVGART